MRGHKGWGVHVLKGLVFAIFLVVAGGVVVTFLWNHLMPAIFGLGAIRFRQAIGLLVLARILFGRPGFCGPMGGMMGRGQWRRRWEQMTPEERERFRAGMRDGCGPAEPKPAP